MTEKRVAGRYDVSQIYLHRPGKAKRKRKEDQRSVDPLKSTVPWTESTPQARSWIRTSASP